MIDQEGFICKHEPGTATKPDEIVRVFACKISQPYASIKDGGTDMLHFVASVDLGHSVEVALSMGLIQAGGTNLFLTLGEKRVKINHAGKKYVEEFLMAWITKLHNAQASTVTLPFGWWTSDDAALPKVAGDRHGFVYGGQLYKDTGDVCKSGLGDPRLRSTFTPIGTLQPWLDACKMITDQKRPELDVLIAAAFAAPLMTVSGKSSVLLSAWGRTGCGKSSAAEVGMAVWGHLKRSKEVAKSTPKSILAKMGETKNLPLYWDEISNSDGSQDCVFNTYFDSTHGIGPSRLNTKIEIQARPDWETMMIAMSNISFVDFVVHKLKSSGGGMYRVLEYNILHRDIQFGKGKAPGQINQLEASRIIAELGNNYGHMGLRYARMLGRNSTKVDAFVVKSINDFDQLVQGNQDERYWLACCGTLIAGATLANTLGATIDVPALKSFLHKVYIDNRARLAEEGVEGGTEEHTLEALAGFFKKYLNETLWTDSMPVGKGRPEPVVFIAGPPINYPKPIQIHWAVKNRMLRICRREFLKYLEEQKMPARVVINGLGTLFGMDTKKAKIAAGTSFQCIQEKLLCIPIPLGSPLEDQMFAHSINRPTDIGAAAAMAMGDTQGDTVHTPIETGLLAGAQQAALDLALVKKHS